MQFKRLKEISELIHQYFTECETIGCFARVTDVALKTDEELQELHGLGYDGITIGAETGDEAALDFMDKGYKFRRNVLIMPISPIIFSILPGFPVLGAALRGRWRVRRFLI